MQAQRFISAVDHVVEHPEVWTQRLAKSKWGGRIPHMERSSQDCDTWVVDGRRMLLSDIANVGALMNDRAAVPKRWEDVPQTGYVPAERLRTMDTDGVAGSVLYPTFAGFSGETFGVLTDPDLELACVQAYNDWVIDEWASYSERFIPNASFPLRRLKRLRRSNVPLAEDTKGLCFPRSRCICERFHTSMVRSTIRSGRLAKISRSPCVFMPDRHASFSFLSLPLCLLN